MYVLNASPIMLKFSASFSSSVFSGAGSAASAVFMFFSYPDIKSGVSLSLKAYDGGSGS